MKMSAYVCSKAHIKALAIFAVRKSHGSMIVDPRYVDGAKDVSGKYAEVIATRYAAILLAENVRSVRVRYTDDIGDYDEIEISKSEALMPKALSAVTILKLCNCLAYQSCETDDWETTNAYKLLQQIKDAAVRALPGYDEAPWGIDEMSEV
jgi:hypothetical protein